MSIFFVDECVCLFFDHSVIYLVKTNNFIHGTASLKLRNTYIIRLHIEKHSGSASVMDLLGDVVPEALF